MTHMSEDRCTVLREDIKEGTWANPVRNMTDLLDEVDRLRAAVVHANEQSRWREALQHIADGYISPSITFARRVLEGDSIEEAHRKAREKMFGS